jgi:UDP-N-acetylglucosamine 4-epimerase
MKRKNKFCGEKYNVACGDRTSNNEILNFLTDRFGELAIVPAPFRPGDVMHTQADVYDSSTSLGYEPLVRFWDGLERTLAWWKL